MSRRRQRVRKLLSALAGGGLTAASIGGPLSAAALGAEAPAAASTSTDSTSPPVTASTPTPAAPSSPAQPTTTSSTPAPTATPPPPSATAPSAAPPPPPPAAPAVVVQRRQKTTVSKRRNVTVTHAKPQAPSVPPGAAVVPKSGVASGPSNVAPAPQLIAGQPGALAAGLASSAASAQALAFYRIPLFLLPIYQAASLQYGVPWQILAAINEIETNYGTDQSVSTAGAVGWMQFMPATWMQYGVDALNAGYADPYNPVDAIFAAARYLRAAGASSSLRTAILAYNHSDEYANSVLLRAKLISTYPQDVIATLTGLTDGHLPVTGKRLAWSAVLATIPGSSATAKAHALAGPASAPGGSETKVAPGGAGAKAAAAGGGPPATATAPSQGGSAGQSASALPGSSAPPSPAAAVLGAAANAPTQFVDLRSAPNAAVVAVQDGRVVRLGSSRALGKYVILRDIYGDVFTYAGLGSIAPTYRPAKAAGTLGSKKAKTSPVAGRAQISLAAVGNSHDPAPRLPASAGRQPPVTLRVKKSAPRTAISQASVPSSAVESAPPGMGKVRLFAHPGNPDALAAAAGTATDRGLAGAAQSGAGHTLALRRGSVLEKGTVLGRVHVPPNAQAGHLRFAIRPAGDRATIDPRPILANWVQLDTALHPKGAAPDANLLGAPASDVFLLSQSQLERTVLSDPGITIYACGRQDIASGAIDRRVLAVLAFLSRSGLKPTVSALECGHSEYTTSGNVSEHYSGDAVDISEINGVPIAAHQGVGTVTDVTIRALLSLQGEFVPHQIISLMQYPGAANTLAMPDHWNHIHVGFHPIGLPGKSVARTAGVGRGTLSPLLAAGSLSTDQWNQLIARAGALPAPSLVTKPSASAIPDAHGTSSNRTSAGNRFP